MKKFNFLIYDDYMNINFTLPIFFNIYLIMGMGIGDWGLGIGPNPQSPIPNPQSPIPNMTLLFEYENILFKMYFIKQICILMITFFLNFR
jgi:hypothetical protein